RNPHTVELTPHHVEVKTNVLPYHKFGFRYGFIKFMKYLFELYPLLGSQFRRNTVYSFRIKRYVKPVWLYQKVLMLYNSSPLVVQLPSNLNTSGPVVGVGYRSIPIAW